MVLFCAEVERVSESDTAEQLKYWVDVEGSENHRAQLDLIPPGSRVLEIGAGPGHMTRALARRDCIVTAVERNEALAAPGGRVRPGPPVRTIPHRLVTLSGPAPTHSPSPPDREKKFFFLLTERCQTPVGGWGDD